MKVTDLPDTNNGIGNKDKENNKGLNKSSESVLRRFEEGQKEGDKGSREKDEDKMVLELFQYQLYKGFGCSNIRALNDPESNTYREGEKSLQRRTVNII